MQAVTISEVKAREILDSKGRPMLEVDVTASDGSLGRGSSPCGTSVGSWEAVVLRDGGERFGGLGVRKALQNVEREIGPELLGRELMDQREIDQLMIDLDGTGNKSRLGANAIYSVSIAVARAAAASRGVPLFSHLSDKDPDRMPVPVFNVLNGGVYGERRVDIQEHLLVPTEAGSFLEALEMTLVVFAALEKTIARKFGQAVVGIGRGAGWAAPVNDPAACLETLLDAVEDAGYGGKFKLGLDCAASQYYNPDSGTYRFMGDEYTRDQMVDYLVKLAGDFPLVLIEDPLDENDFEGHARLLASLPILISGDDLLVTNPDRIKQAVELKAANAVVIKPNMIGSLTEASDAARYAADNGFCIIPGGRGGGSVDDPVTDLAAALGAPMVKFGAPRWGEKINKYNRLLQIADECGGNVKFTPFADIERIIMESRP